MERRRRKTCEIQRTFFISSMCKVLIFRSLEKLVSQQEWYQLWLQEKRSNLCVSELMRILSAKGRG